MSPSNHCVWRITEKGSLQVQDPTSRVVREGAWLKVQSGVKYSILRQVPGYNCRQNNLPCFRCVVESLREVVRIVKDLCASAWSLLNDLKVEFWILRVIEFVTEGILSAETC